MDKEVKWEIDLVQITGDGSKPEDYEAIARLDYAKFLESLPSAFYHQLDANQLEVQPILDKDFKTLAQEKWSRSRSIDLLFWHRKNPAMEDRIATQWKSKSKLGS